MRRTVKESDSLFNEACKVYFKYCLENGIVPENPIKNQTKIGRLYVHLKRDNEVLGKYNFIKKCLSKQISHNKLFPIEEIKGIVFNDNKDSIF